jgi:hypothetical protein
MRTKRPDPIASLQAKYHGYFRPLVPRNGLVFPAQLGGESRFRATAPSVPKYLTACRRFCVQRSALSLDFLVHVLRGC